MLLDDLIEHTDERTYVIHMDRVAKGTKVECKEDGFVFEKLDGNKVKISVMRPGTIKIL